MCGRLNIHDHVAVIKLLEQLGLPLPPPRPPRYNGTPGSSYDVIYQIDKELTTAPMEWGIAFGDFRHPNTKTETVKRKPHLQKLILAQRCLLPVNRFYEWPDPKVRPKYQGIKTRFCIHTLSDVMLMGGIWKISADGVMQFNILTTDPNDAMNDFHHRMPVIVPPEKVPEWFGANTLDDMYSLLNPYRGDLNIYQCDAYVDNGRHEGPRCMNPIGESF